MLGKFNRGCEHKRGQQVYRMAANSGECIVHHEYAQKQSFYLEVLRFFHDAVCNK